MFAAHTCEPRGPARQRGGRAKEAVGGERGENRKKEGRSDEGLRESGALVPLGWDWRKDVVLLLLSKKVYPS